MYTSNRIPTPVDMSEFPLWQVNQSSTDVGLESTAIFCIIYAANGDRYGYKI